MSGVRWCAMIAAASLVSMPVASADDTDDIIRFGLGGYLHPQYDAVLGLLGEPPYPLDVGASLWPASVPQVIDYPASPRTMLRYDANVAVGVDNLDAAITAALDENPDQRVVVAGVSMGSIVIDHYLTSLADDPNAPSPDEIQFATYADPQRGLLRLLPDDFRLPGYVNAPVPETPYDVTVVYSEYDGFSDPPDRPWNLVATANAVAGAWLLHGTEIYADLDDIEPDIETNDLGGTTTTYRVPAERLPLLKPLDAVLPNVIVDQVDELVRPVVNRGYSRHDDPGDTRPVLRGGQIVRPGRGGADTDTDADQGVEP